MNFCLFCTPVDDGVQSEVEWDRRARTQIRHEKIFEYIINDYLFEKWGARDRRRRYVKIRRKNRGKKKYGGIKDGGKSPENGACVVCGRE